MSKNRIEAPLEASAYPVKFGMGNGAQPEVGHRPFARV